MKRKFNHIAVQTGDRPLLAGLLLLICAFFLSFGLLRFVLKSQGLLLFDWDARQTACFLGALILLTYGALTWRLMTSNQLIKGLILDEFHKAKGRGPEGDEVGQLKSIAQKLHFQGGYFSRNFQVARIIPLPVTALIAVLLAANIVLKIAFDLLYDPSKSNQGMLFANVPWVIAVLVFIYLVYHDIWAIDELRSRIVQLGNLNPISNEQHLRQFTLLLTNMESQCFQKKYQEQARNKNIAAALDISESTVKTHINNINRKWDQYALKQGIRLSLKAFLT